MFESSLRTKCLKALTESDLRVLAKCLVRRLGAGRAFNLTSALAWEVVAAIVSCNLPGFLHLKL